MRTLSCVVGVLHGDRGLYVPVIGAEDHVMVTPNELKWADILSLPPGAKPAVIEGPWIKRFPSSFGLHCPPTTKSPRTGIRPLNMSR